MTTIAEPSVSTVRAGVVVDDTVWDIVSLNWERLSWPAKRAAVDRLRREHRTLVEDSARVEGDVLAAREVLDQVAAEAFTLVETRNALQAEITDLRCQWDDLAESRQALAIERRNLAAALARVDRQRTRLSVQQAHLVAERLAAEFPDAPNGESRRKAAAADVAQHQAAATAAKAGA